MNIFNSKRFTFNTPILRWLRGKLEVYDLLIEARDTLEMYTHSNRFFSLNKYKRVLTPRAVSELQEAIHRLGKKKLPSVLG